MAYGISLPGESYSQPSVDESRIKPKPPRVYCVFLRRSLHVELRHPEIMRTRLEFRLQAAPVECNPLGLRRTTPPAGGTPNAVMRSINMHMRRKILWTLLLVGAA